MKFRKCYQICWHLLLNEDILKYFYLILSFPMQDIILFPYRLFKGETPHYLFTTDCQQASENWMGVYWGSKNSFPKHILFKYPVVHLKAIGKFSILNCALRLSVQPFRMEISRVTLNVSLFFKNIHEQKGYLQKERKRKKTNSFFSSFFIVVWNL